MAKKPIVTVAQDSESIISMILGAMVVIVIGALLFSYIRDWRKGQTTDAPAEEIPTEPVLTEELPSEVKLETTESGESVPTGLPAKYTVKAGDTTWAIAEAFYGSGFNYVDIEEANGLSRDTMIEEGQTLTIPKVAVRTAALAAQPTKYEEKDGVATGNVGPSKGDDSAAEALIQSK